MDDSATQRRLVLSGKIKEVLSNGGMINHDPPLSYRIEQCLRTFDADFKAFDWSQIHDQDEDFVTALMCCLTSGLAELRCEVTAHDINLDRAAVFEMSASGDYRESIGKEIHKLWPLHNSHQQSDWKIKLTADGMGAKLDLESGDSDRLRRACQFAFYIKNKAAIRLRLIGSPNRSQQGIVINNQVNVPVSVGVSVPVNVDARQAETSCNSNGTNGDGGVHACSTKKRFTEWVKVREMLDTEGCPETDDEKDDFIARYNQSWKGKPAGNDKNLKWPSLGLSKLKQLIREKNATTKTG